VSYGKATTYFPVIELLHSYFAVEPRDDDRKMREKVTGKLLSLDRALEPTLLVFLSLLDLPVEDAEWTKLDPSQRKRQTLDALKHLLLRESQVQPVLLVVEDLHWIDSQTQAWLDLLVESLPTARLLLLVNYRPEYRHGWGGKTYYQQVRLDALPLASAEELLEGLLGTGPGLPDLRRLLIDRTEGNPFFLEESVRTLVETGALSGERGSYRLAGPIQNLQLPATAHAILAARIDRLSPEDKRLLQAAAVVGKDVPFPLLEAIAEETAEHLREGLARLQAAEFLYEARLFPDLEYTFKHALTHEVAYGGLLHDRRRTLHASVLEAMERLYADRLDEHVERLAHHAVRGDVPDKAVPYLRQAGLKAAARSAPQDAQGWFEQALGILEALPESQAVLEQAFEIRLDLRMVLNVLGDVRGTLEHVRQAEQLAERLNDDPRRGRACAFMTITHSMLGELDEALVTGARALGIAGRLGDLRLRILTTSFLDMTQYYRGEYERVVELATDNLAALPAGWVHESFGASQPASVYDRCWLVMSLAELGRFAQAAEYEAEAIKLAESTHHAYTIQQAYRAAGTLHLLKGDWAKARSLIEREMAVARTGNIGLHLPQAVASSAWVLAQLGEATEALNRLREGEQLVERYATGGAVIRLGWICAALSRAGLLLGRLDEARRLGDRAIDASPHQPGFAAHALHLLGDIATHPGQFNAEQGEAHYRQALALAEPRGMRPLVAHCHFSLGRLYRKTDKRQEAEEHLTTATTMYREMGMTYWLEKAQAEMGQLSS
jgi:tetratricopeptide (TPR) repeat protein